MIFGIKGHEETGTWEKKGGGGRKKGGDLVGLSQGQFQKFIVTDRKNMRARGKPLGGENN